MYEYKEFKQANSYFLVFASHFKDSEVMDYLRINDISFSPLLGCYKGVKETSFCVKLADYKRLKEQSKLLHKQECVMIVQPKDIDGIRKVYFDYLNGEEDKLIGKLVTLDIPRGHSPGYSIDWTFDPNTNQYFTIEEV